MSDNRKEDLMIVHDIQSEGAYGLTREQIEKTAALVARRTHIPPSERKTFLMMFGLLRAKNKWHPDSMYKNTCETYDCDESGRVVLGQGKEEE